MSDRELLALAAKAAGIELACWDDGSNQWIRLTDDPEKVRQTGNGWGAAVFDPLNDDGDALRLAAKLKIDIEWQATQVGAEPAVEAYCYELDGGCFCASEHENDYRRAIVRSAAEIGKSLP